MLVTPPRRGRSKQMLSARSYNRDNVETQLPPITANKLNPRGTKDDSDVLGNVEYTTDIAAMIQIRQEMDKLLQLSIKLINDNESTPDIQTTLTPIISNVSRAFDVFFRNAMHYFTQQYRIQQSAKTNQVLSSASCRIPIQNLRVEWNLTCKIIDKYTESHPPPHAEEIKTKFQAIQSAFTNIQQSNDNRKNPNIMVQKTLGSIKLLCETLSNNIHTLFHQNAFPHFETDLLKGYTNDVLSFKKVLIDAFGNEFLQAGIATPVLVRLKANFIADCNSIIESLKSAFAFPDQMSEIHSTKDNLNKLLENIWAKLNVPFAVIKPNNQNDTAFRAPPPPTLAEIASIEAANEERKKANELETLTNGIQAFLRKMQPYVSQMDLDKEPVDILLSIAPEIIDSFNLIVEQNEKIEQFKKSMKEDIVVHAQKKSILESKISTLTQALEDRTKQYNESLETNKELLNKQEELQNTINNMTKEMGKLTEFGNPNELRGYLVLFLRDLEKIFPNPEPFFKNNNGSKQLRYDKEIIPLFKEIITNLRQKNDDLQLHILVGQKHEEIRKKLESLLGVRSSNMDELCDKFDEFNKENADKIKHLTEELDELKARVTKFTDELGFEGIDMEDSFPMIIDKNNEQINNIKKLEEEKKKLALASVNSFRNISTTLKSQFPTKKNNSIPDVNSVRINYDNIDETFSEIDDIIFQQVANAKDIVDRAKEDKAKIKKEMRDIVSKHNDIEKQLEDELDIVTESDNNIPFIQKAIKQIRAIREPLQKEISHLNSHITDIQVRVNIIYSRVCAITQQLPSEGDVLQLLDKVTEMLGLVQDITDSEESKKKEQAEQLVIYRQCLEKLYVQLRKEAEKIEPDIDLESDISNMSASDISDKVKVYADYVTTPAYSNEFINNQDVKQIFSAVLETLDCQESSTKDCLYLIAGEYMKMFQAVTNLSNFSNHVNNAKKFIDENRGTEKITNLPQVITTVSNAFEAIVKNVQYPQLVNLCYRLMAIIDFLIDYNSEEGE